MNSPVGFSRGAYQIRVLAGMIEKVGLIHKGNEAQIPFAWQLYRRSTDNKHDGQVDMAARFKETFCHPKVTIHFVGAWDTVSSIGLSRRKVDLPLTTLGMKHVCYFRHALALHEHRVKFLPEYARGGAGPVEEDSDREHEAQGGTGSKMPRVKEVWFAGTHSDIGGGNTENMKLIRNGPSLRWMVTQARKAGLRIGPSYGEWGTSAEVLQIHESLNGIWKVFELLPFKRLSYKDERATTRSLHRGEQRKIVKGQLIHESVDRVNDKELPREWLPVGWRNEAPTEWDAFDKIAEQASDALKTLLDHSLDQDVEERRNAMDALRRIAYGEFGTMILGDLSQLLFNAQSQIGLTMERACVAMEVLIELGPPNKCEDRQACVTHITPIIRKMLGQDNYKPVVKKFLDKYASRALYSLANPGINPVIITFCADNHTIAFATPDGHPGGAPFLNKWGRYSVWWHEGAQTLAYSHGKLTIGSVKGLQTYNPGTSQFSGIIDRQPTVIVSLSADREQMVTCTDSPHHVVQLWRISDGVWKQTRIFEPNDCTIQKKHIEFSPSGREIVTLGYTEGFTEVRVMTTDYDEEQARFDRWTGLGAEVLAVSKSTVDDMVYVGGHGNKLRRWSLKDWDRPQQPLVLHPTDHYGRDMAITVLTPSPDGTTILVGSNSGIRVFDTGTGVQVGDVLFRDQDVVCAAWASDGKTFVAANKEGQVVVFDATPDGDGLQRAILEGWGLEENPEAFNLF
ncbi:hypothetical protein V5O48_014495 [Marasmius crinis-equi]|uniref:T6SS Phospholipase effector Tle1-like catalytic domain-containing protein n=1 Tax=Marasmius crinis-equi TaxID=585013 RepID=A0ABR3EXF8_9AGAR